VYYGLIICFANVFQLLQNTTSPDSEQFALTILVATVTFLIGIAIHFFGLRATYLIFAQVVDLQDTSLATAFRREANVNLWQAYSASGAAIFFFLSILPAGETKGRIFRLEFGYRVLFIVAGIACIVFMVALYFVTSFFPVYPSS
jgi:hypothetical protein